MTLIHTELGRLTGFQILQTQPPLPDPTLVLNTTLGPLHVIVTRENLLTLSDAFAKYAEEIQPYGLARVFGWLKGAEMLGF